MKAVLPLALVPTERVKAVCLIGAGAACCRYLTCGASGFECGKLTDLAAMLDARVAAGQMTARGDNCDGIQPGYAKPEAAK